MAVEGQAACAATCLQLLACARTGSKVPLQLERARLFASPVSDSRAPYLMRSASPSVEALPALAADHGQPASDETPSLEEKEPSDYDIEKDSGYDNDASKPKNLSKVAEVTKLTPAEAFDVNVDGDESPFPEVNASVSTTDDPSIQVNST